MGCCGEKLVDEISGDDVVSRCPVHGVHYTNICISQGYRVCGAQPYLRLYAVHAPVDTKGGPLASFGETVSSEPLRVIGPPRFGTRDSDKKVDAWARCRQHPYLEQMFGAFMGASSIVLHGPHDEKAAGSECEAALLRDRWGRVLSTYAEQENKMLDEMTAYIDMKHVTASLGDEYDLHALEQMVTVRELMLDRASRSRFVDEVAIRAMALLNKDRQSWKSMPGDRAESRCVVDGVDPRGEHNKTLSRHDGWTRTYQTDTNLLNLGLNLIQPRVRSPYRSF